MVGLTRFELVTSSMSTRHSNQLSYNPITTLFILQHFSVSVNLFFAAIQKNSRIIPVFIYSFFL